MVSGFDAHAVHVSADSLGVKPQLTRADLGPRVSDTLKFLSVKQLSPYRSSRSAVILGNYHTQVSVNDFRDKPRQQSNVKNIEIIVSEQVKKALQKHREDFANT